MLNCRNTHYGEVYHLLLQVEFGSLVPKKVHQEAVVGPLLLIDLVMAFMFMAGITRIRNWIGYN
ncbi:hypothetical protein [Marinisporobacter balticus]|uniref:hypothetical protein n=1 Tax=Marinisporobacter balticus TaxID=2018667 RepID=UPI001A9BBE50